MAVFLSSIFILCAFAVDGQEQKLPADTLRPIRLDEVTVTATQPDAPGTISVIGRDAIRHIQAADLSDLSQLLPGVLTRNPNLNTPGVFTIRSAAANNETNAQGTAILVDGLRMNNNNNLQRIGFKSTGALFNSSALSGFDVRSLSAASIESVEVIRGVPSARYGDVTSGMVLVKSKAGLQPYTVGLRFTSSEKLASVGKGLALGAHGGILYWGADYALSTQDPRLPERSFQRVGLQAAYAHDFTHADMRVNLRGYWAQDKDGKGANTIDGEFQKAFSRGFSLSANGKWTIRKPWISTLEYQAGLTYGHQRNEANTYYSGTQQVTTYTREPGEQAGVFLAPNYFGRIRVEGKPLSAEASLTANLRHTLYNKVYNHFLLGLEANTEGNRGTGIGFDPLRPPFEMLDVRNRSYSELPFVNRYTAFAEDRVSFHLGRMRTEVQAGLRIDRLHTDALRYTAADPRINVRHVLVERPSNARLRHFSLRAGWGLMHKMPPLAYLYPDKAYTDKNTFTYNDAENNHRLGVVHTFVTDRTFNSHLRLPMNRKFELGANLKLGGLTADVVWFSEHLSRGYCTTWQADPFTYRYYDPLPGKGERPKLTDNGLINNGQSLPYAVRTAFASYLRPENGIEQQKQGVEYSLDPGRFPALYSSFLISGGYLRVREKNTALSTSYPTVEVNGKAYPYAGIYEATYLASNLRVWEQFNTRFQCITQLPRIGLIASLTLQAVWIDREQRGMESQYNNPVYLVDDAGNRIEGDPATDTKHRKRLNPVYYLDVQGSRHPFTLDMATDKRFADLVVDAGLPTAFVPDSWGPYFLLNLRVTKQIGRYVSVAFCANNITQSNPKRYTGSTQQYIIRNPDLYYGAEVAFQF